MGRVADKLGFGWTDAVHDPSFSAEKLHTAAETVRTVEGMACCAKKKIHVRWLSGLGGLACNFRRDLGNIRRRRAIQAVLEHDQLLSVPRRAHAVLRRVRFVPRRGFFV